MQELKAGEELNLFIDVTQGNEFTKSVFDMEPLADNTRVEMTQGELAPFVREFVLRKSAKLCLTYKVTRVTAWQETCIVRLAGEGASVKIRGIMHGQAEADLQYFLTVRHEADATESEIEFRGVAEDKSHLVLDGLIQAPEGCKGIVANLQNKNLLLSNMAIVEARPRLEIDTDDVVCRHGATVGDLDSNQLFYLMSRGMTEQEAREILIEAFLDFIEGGETL